MRHSLARMVAICNAISEAPWCSSEDIAKGARGGLEIAEKLGKVNFGIVCLTPSNLHNEWIHFESGALTKNVDHSALFTLLLDLQPSDIKPPLGHFQHTRFSKEELKKLVQSINEKTEKQLTSEALIASFEAFWPRLEDAFSKLPHDSASASPARSDREILEEILSAVRNQPQPSLTNTGADAQDRRAVGLVAFTDGLLRGRKSDASVTGRLSGDDVALVIKQGAYDLVLTVPSSLKSAQAKDLVQDFVSSNTISDDDIPF